MLNPAIHQRASKSETETLLIDVDGSPVGTTKAGLVGGDIVTMRFLSMRRTDAMRGRSCGSSWTQSSPMWMHLSISSLSGSSAG